MLDRLNIDTTGLSFWDLVWYRHRWRRLLFVGRGFVLVLATPPETPHG